LKNLMLTGAASAVLTFRFRARQLGGTLSRQLLFAALEFDLMMYTLALITLVVSPILSLLLTTLTYALRDFSRARFAESLKQGGKDDYFESTVNHAPDLSFVASSGRIIANLFFLLSLIELLRGTGYPVWIQYLLALITAALILMIVSLALPRSIANHSGEAFIAKFVRPLHVIWLLASPVTRLMHTADRIVKSASSSVERTPETIQSELHEEILEKVEQGSREGAVDDGQRELIESVMELGHKTVDEIMRPRRQMVALPIDAGLEVVRNTLVSTGHSRIPVYKESVDKIIGVIYARDLLKLWEQPAWKFKLSTTLRTPLYVPATKFVQELLQDFRLQKVHIAIVLDEYGGTAGLVTIEDVIEEIIGDISDEHEPLESAMFHRIDDHAAEVDARLSVDELNRLLGLEIPEDQEYETLGGFVTTTLSTIPIAGAVFESHGAKLTVLEADPKRVKRLRVEVLPHDAVSHESSDG